MFLSLLSLLVLELSKGSELPKDDTWGQHWVKAQEFLTWGP